MNFAFGKQTWERLRERAKFKVYLEGGEARLQGYARALWQLFNSLFDDIICQRCRNNVLVNTSKSALVGRGFFRLFLCVSASPLEHGRHRRQRRNRRRHRPVDELGGEHQSGLISEDPQLNLVKCSLSFLDTLTHFHQGRLQSFAGDLREKSAPEFTTHTVKLTSSFRFFSIGPKMSYKGNSSSNNNKTDLTFSFPNILVSLLISSSRKNLLKSGKVREESVGRVGSSESGGGLEFLYPISAPVVCERLWILKFQP